MKRSFSSCIDYNSDNEKQLDFLSSFKTETNQSNINLECRVCGGPAHGYNFDQISCESCKAFFRRNALKNLSELKCRYSGRCSITMGSRRRCAACRLRKCFDVNMRKEWIRTDEERHLIKLKHFHKQQKKIERFHNNFPKIISSPLATNSSNQNSPSIIKMNDKICCLKLSCEDWSLIDDLSEIYDIWALGNETNDLNNYSRVDSSLIDFLNDEQMVYQNLIEFFKQIPHFHQIDIEDQILLIKCNLTHLIHIHYLLKDHFQEHPQFSFLMTKWINGDFSQHMSKIRHSCNLFVDHPIVLKIVLVILIFLLNLSCLPLEELAMEFLNRNLLIKNQNFFINLFWKYVHVISNEHEAIQATQWIVFQYLRYQLLINEMEIFIRKENHSEQFHPLIRSIFRLTN